jgi:hypothetical protein
MKNLIIIVFAAILIGVGGCMKNYENDVVPEVDDGFFQLKAGNALITTGDTAWVNPGVYVKFWLDSLPESASNYSYAWNLGNGATSVSESPEQVYTLGIYGVSVLVTKLSNNQTVQRSITLVVRNDISFETTIILLESTPVTGGNYNYKLALQSSVIYNYENTTGPRWVSGHFTGWNQHTVTEVMMINQIEYMIYHLILPANNVEKQRWGYGRGNNWAFAPKSLFWFVNAQGEGAFEAYFTNGQMSKNPISSNNLPGDGGDVNLPDIPATTRTEIVGSNDDILRVYVNHGVYANGASPFITQFISNNNWSPVVLTSIGNGWGYKDFQISNLVEGKLFWRFGQNINNPNVFGNMQNSKFFVSENNWLAIQIVQIKLGKYEIIKL